MSRPVSKLLATTVLMLTGLTWSAAFTAAGPRGGGGGGRGYSAGRYGAPGYYGGRYGYPGYYGGRYGGFYFRYGGYGWYPYGFGYVYYPWWWWFADVPVAYTDVLLPFPNGNGVLSSGPGNANAPIAYMYPESSAVVGGNQARLEVLVPAGADVWVDGVRATQSGPVRVFVTPPLAPGVLYTYKVRAAWTDGEVPVSKTRTVRIRANRVSVADFVSRPPRADRPPY